MARRLFEERASEENKRALPRRYEGESNISLYHELQRLSAPLQIGTILTMRGGNGGYVHVGNDKARIKTSGDKYGWGNAISNHVMRAGKHYATFQVIGAAQNIGFVRPIKEWGRTSPF